MKLGVTVISKNTAKDRLRYFTNGNIDDQRLIIQFRVKVNEVLGKKIDSSNRKSP